jgi:hypothetical protein
MSRLAYGLKIVTVFATAALFVAPVKADEPKLDNLDGAIKAVAPKVLMKLREGKYDNVGVLKFFVADSDGMLRDNVGPLNRTLADRFEVALTLLLEDNDKIGIIVGAGDVVAKSGNHRATHRTASGRKELFMIGAKTDDKLFSVPWKPRQKILPDAFLTGEATMSKDRHTIAVKVQLFDKKTPADLVTVAEFTAAVDLRTLTETGVTFAANKRGGDITEALAMVDQIAPAGNEKGDELKKKAGEALKALEQSPVKLEIYYNGKLQKVTADADDKHGSNVLLRVPAPANKPDEKTEVSFRLTHQGDTDDAYGVVLRVNGRNTIYEQRQDPLSCYKWILEKGKSVTVTGFQLNKEDNVPFEVMSPEESEKQYGMYGDNAGTFDLIVFRGIPKPESALVKADDPERVAISRGAMTLRDEPPATDLKSFKAQLKREGTETTAASRSGGMIGAGATIGKNPIKQMDFYPSSVPVLSTTIRYYSPKK